MQLYVYSFSPAFRRMAYTAIGLWCLLAARPVWGQSGNITVPPDFYHEQVRTDFTNPVGMTFDENNRLYVWEKGGTVYLVDTNGNRLPNPLIDLSDEVGDWYDHGLLGFALDPAFLSNGFVYLLYVVDPHHLMHYGTAQYSTDSLDIPGATIGRLVRYTADASDNFESIDPASRVILLGESPSTGIPLVSSFHGIGTIAFGLDGTLLISNGDGTSPSMDVGMEADTFVDFTQQALQRGILTADQHVGQFRSQYLGSLSGKVLRVDPVTGDGVPSNPFYDPQNPRSPQSRTWSLGYRNPFRMSVFPGTGSHVASDGNPGKIIVGDVGATEWEEINLLDQGGLNGGWPLFEGQFFNNSWNNVTTPTNLQTTNPLHGSSGCDEPFLRFDALISYPHLYPTYPNPCDNNTLLPPTIHTMAMHPPVYAYRNRFHNSGDYAFIQRYRADGSSQVVEVSDSAAWVESESISGKCSIGGVFYDQALFPEAYHNAYFHGDYGGWIKAFFFDDNQELVRVEPFMDGADQLLNLVANPNDGCLYYISGITGINRICYGGNPAPQAIIVADTTFGASPLTVTLDASASFDVFGDPLSFYWDLGNGQTSTDTVVTTTFESAEGEPLPFKVRLVVTDSTGLTGEAEQVISVNNTPPIIDILTFEDGDRYPGLKSTILPLEGAATDLESPDEALVYKWQTYLHHNDHFHPEAPDFRRKTYMNVDPLGCGYEPYFYRVALEVTDEHGLTARVEKYIYPYCGGDFVDFFDLKGTAQDQQVRLDWRTSFEDSVDYFVVERSSDIWHFEALAEVPAGQLDGRYQWVDPLPLQGNAYYRIKAYRVDRKFAYSPRVNFKFTSGIVDVFPNPSNGWVNFYFADDYEAVRVTWRDAQGRVVDEQRFAQVKADQIERIRTDKMAVSGLYFYTIEADGQVSNGKLLFTR